MPDPLSRIDLNLLVALNALIQERSVTGAAVRLGITQSAASRVLARLRLVFGDEILEKSGRSMVLTTRAVELAEPLLQILEEVGSLIRPPVFRPELDGGRIRIVTPSILALPEVLIDLSRVAPKLKIEVSHATDAALSLLESGNSDLLIDTLDEVSRPFRHIRLMTGQFVCLVRKGHPRVRLGFDESAYVSATHVTTNVATRPILDGILRRFEIERKSMMVVPSTVLAAELASRTDWVLTAPEAISSRLCKMFQLEKLTFPFDGPDLWLDVIWHVRSDGDPVHGWVRERLVATLLQDRD